MHTTVNHQSVMSHSLQFKMCTYQTPVGLLLRLLFDYSNRETQTTDRQTGDITAIELHSKPVQNYNRNTVVYRIISTYNMHTNNRQGHGRDGNSS